MCDPIDTNDQDENFIKVSKFLLRHLFQLKMKCGNLNCTFGQDGNKTYLEVLDHSKKCLLDMYQCPFNLCGESHIGFKIEKHLEECRYAIETCETCKLNFPKMIVNNHNCLEELKEKLKFENN